jgi:serine O-acetyltransferase
MRLQHNRLPDPMLRVLNEALDQQRRLERRVRELELAPPRVAPSPLPAQQPSMPLAREADIRQALKDVIDPEVGFNVVDLGLIREIAFNGGGVEVRMVLTSPAWPSAGYLVEQVRRKVESVVDGKPVKVVLVDDIWSWNDAAPRLLWGDGI